MRRQDYTCSVRELPTAEGWRAVALIDGSGYVAATYSARLHDWDDEILDRLLARASPVKPLLKILK